MKPSNVLLNSLGQVKLCDFGDGTQNEQCNHCREWHAFLIHAINVTQILKSFFLDKCFRQIMDLHCKVLVEPDLVAVLQTRYFNMLAYMTNEY